MIQPYLRAGFPALALATPEEGRFTQHVLTDFPDKAVLGIAATGGLRDLRSGAVLDAGASFSKAFAACAARPDTLLIAHDFQHIARNAPAYRALKDALPDLKASGSCVLMLAPSWALPPELMADVAILEWALPTRDELRAALGVVAHAVGQNVAPALETACLDAAAGLTLAQAEDAFSLALVETGALDPLRIAAEKARLVRSSGYLEVWPAASPAAVGGLDRLKAYFAEEVLPCRHDDLLRVRGVLLVGLPGAGKSLAAKAASGMLGWPLLRLDVGSLKGSLVGQSEANMRAALRLAEAVAPCVLWLDEIEKAVGGFASSAQSDSGVTLGLVGSLLTWLQEHRSPILTIATANDHGKLPPELTRAGRFDEQFFLDLPTPAERIQIARIHLLRYMAPESQTESQTVSASHPTASLPGDALDLLSLHLAGLSNEWTGAEIEGCVKSAARRTARRITAESLTTCAGDIRPILRTRIAEFTQMREWARGALRPASAPDDTPPATGRRVATSQSATGQSARGKAGGSSLGQGGNPLLN